MHRKIGVGIGVGRCDLRKDRQFRQQIAPRVHHRFRQAGDEVIAELLPRHQVEGGSQRRQVVGRHRRRAAQGALGHVKTLESALLTGDGARLLDDDEHRRGLRFAGITMWMSGYYNASVRSTVIDLYEFAQAAKTVKDYCATSPRATVMSAAERALGIKMPRGR
jgi:HdeA/HdeB family